MILLIQPKQQNDCNRKEDFHVMIKGQWYQCQQCGFVHQVKRCFDIEEDLFVEIPCEHCRGDTKHIWIGGHPEDVYRYGNANLDDRYYNYKTK